MTIRDFTTTALLADIRRRAWIPESDADLTDAVILSIADEVIEEFILPEVTKRREDFFVRQQDSAIVANQAAYDLPQRMYGGPLRDVTYIDASGNGARMARLSLEDRDLYATGGTGVVQAFVIQDDQLVLLPTPSSTTGSVRMRYFRRPNRLVAETTCEKVVSSVKGATTTAVVVASDIILSGAGSVTVDLIRATPDFGTHADSATMTWVSSTNRTINQALDLRAGDYIGREHESPIAQIPHPFFGPLAEGVAMRIVEMRGDAEGFGKLGARFVDGIARAGDMISPRVHGTQKRTVNHNSPLRVSSGRGYGRGWR